MVNPMRWQGLHHDLSITAPWCLPVLFHVSSSNIRIGVNKVYLVTTVDTMGMVSPVIIYPLHKTSVWERAICPSAQSRSKGFINVYVSMKVFLLSQLRVKRYTWSDYERLSDKEIYFLWPWYLSVMTTFAVNIVSIFLIDESNFTTIFFVTARNFYECLLYSSQGKRFNDSITRA